ERVGRTFANGVVALERLNLDVRPGEFVSLLGPSGCGKSTALRIIAGLSEPTSGTVEWLEAEAASAAGPRRIGFVFQEPTLMPWATVGANVRPPPAEVGRARAARAGARRRGARARRPFRIRAELSARALGRHEDAPLDRARARPRAEAPADGRAVRRARRDHALSPQ